MTTILADRDPRAATVSVEAEPWECDLHLGGGATGLEVLVATLLSKPSMTKLRAAFDDRSGARAAPVVRLVDHALHRAVEEGASDIHIEESGSEVRVRYRVDGFLRRAVELPAASRRAVLSRIKVMAGMDISVRRRPQDGRISHRHGALDLTLRVSTLPVNGGEKAVVRILDPESVPPNLDALGLANSDRTRVRSVLAVGEGVILVAGPTGSGKSTTLFAALSEVDRDRLNVVTLEDPVEYRLPGANQVRVDPRVGLGFAEALRSVLRQDPDVVMIGEIRDRETAEIAMTAAVTGHLVLSTIQSTDIAQSGDLRRKSTILTLVSPLLHYTSAALRRAWGHTLDTVTGVPRPRPQRLWD